ncbi:sensor domain-containing protein [Tomitella cavernea]|uniref:Putative sensor domain-containing protein n=1 Tax=Tomitella cavernea TaxID=1387982 RepID=A0ABP9C188_9ACTN|nr:sensor domain-containing protein [Tomitella cavernea]
MVESSETTASGRSGPAASILRVVLALFTRRSWAELAYALVSLPVGMAGFILAVASLSIGGVLVITFVGLPLIAVTGAAARWLGGCWRAGTNRLLGWDVPAPAPFRARRPGMLGRLVSALQDGTAWRAILYFIVKLPLGIASSVVSIVLYSYGLGALSYGLWRRWLPCVDGGPGAPCHRAMQLGDGRYLESTAEIVWLAVAGVVVLLLAPWAVRAVLAVERPVLRVLLGPSRTASRVTELEHSRAQVVD